MTIDRRLYTKITGRVPGEAMNRMGASLARSQARRMRARENAGRDRVFSSRYLLGSHPIWRAALVVSGIMGFITAWRMGLFRGW